MSSRAFLHWRCALVWPATLETVPWEASQALLRRCPSVFMVSAWQPYIGYFAVLAVPHLIGGSRDLLQSRNVHLEVLPGVLLELLFFSGLRSEGGS